MLTPSLARTVQTSTVYGGAGADTLILGDTAAASQIIELTSAPSLEMTALLSLVPS